MLATATAAIASPYPCTTSPQTPQPAALAPDWQEADTDFLKAKLVPLKVSPSRSRDGFTVQVTRVWLRAWNALPLTGAERAEIMAAVAEATEPGAIAHPARRHTRVRHEPLGAVRTDLSGGISLTWRRIPGSDSTALLTLARA